MKEILLLTLLLASGAAYADNSTTEKPTFPPVNWVSKNSKDLVTINNGAGTPIVIVITVNPNPNPGTPTPYPTGIKISNCGTTTAVNAGSSAICMTSDANNPVTFSSDSPTTAISGIYQIKQQ